MRVAWLGDAGVLAVAMTVGPSIAEPLPGTASHTNPAPGAATDAVLVNGLGDAVATALIALGHLHRDDKVVEANRRLDRGAVKQWGELEN